MAVKFADERNCLTYHLIYSSIEHDLHTWYTPVLWNISTVLLEGTEHNQVPCLLGWLKPENLWKYYFNEHEQILNVQERKIQWGISLVTDWSHAFVLTGQGKSNSSSEQPKYSIKHNLLLIHNYSVKPVTKKTNLSVCLSVIFFSLCSAELAKETYFHVKLWDHSSTNQPVPGIQIEARGAKNRMQFYCFNFLFLFPSTSALTEHLGQSISCYDDWCFGEIIWW